MGGGQGTVGGWRLIWGVSLVPALIKSFMLLVKSRRGIGDREKDDDEEEEGDGVG